MGIPAATNMKQCFFLAALMLVLMISSSSSTRARKLSPEMTMEERHEQWMVQHGRVYQDEAEKQRRFQIFKSNVDRIESFNAAGRHKYLLGVNQFADMTNEEFRTSRTGFKNIKAPANAIRNRGFRYENIAATPVSMDWRTKGAVTPVKDQGQCGI